MMMPFNSFFVDTRIAEGKIAEIIADFQFILC